MIHFVVALGSPGAVVELTPRLQPSLERSRLFEGTTLAYAADDHMWSAAALTLADSICSDRFVVEGDALAIVNGPALALRGKQVDVARDALAAFRVGGTEGVARTLGGAYNFVGVAPGIGGRACSDFSGSYPLYWWRGDGVAVVANRWTTVAAVADVSAWNVDALGWLIGRDNLFGDDMPGREISHLPPGHEACIDADGHVELRRSREWVWPGNDAERGRENLSASEWDEVTDQLIGNFRALKSLPEAPALFLTGGKDSRLCLALAKAAELEDRIVTVTTGRDDSPEVECASLVARAAGFEHVRRGHRASPDGQGNGAVARAPRFDAACMWARLRRHSYRYEGVLPAWHETKDVASGSLDIKGFGGELYRRSHTKWFRKVDATSVDAMAKLFVEFHRVSDPLGLLRRRVSKRQREWLRDWVHRNGDEIRFDLLPEKFYVDFRLTHWNGPIFQDNPSNVVLVPLLSRRAVQKSLELSSRARSSERFHFEVMRRAAPELVALPFLRDKWSDVIAKDCDVPLAEHPFASKVSVASYMQKSWQWQFLSSEEAAIGALFADAHRTAMDDVCRMLRLRSVARTAARCEQRPAAKSIINAVGVALTALDRSAGLCDDVAEHEPPDG